MNLNARLVCVCCLWLAGCATVPKVPSAIPPATKLYPPIGTSIQRIVVDAGHGGQDPGTMHFGLQEKHLNLDIARRLQAELQSSGWTVVLTRDRDEFIELSRRARIANRLPADVFVSIHVNANRRQNVDGVEVYYPRESVVEMRTSLPPRVQPEEVASTSMSVRHALWDLVLSQTRRQSAVMAQHVCRALQNRLHVRCRGVHGARFVVLREAWTPAILVEAGYVSNREEASHLATADYRQAIAEAIAEGLVSYAQATLRES